MRLIHRFWLWAGRKIEHHRFLEDMSGDYKVEIELEKSIQLTPTEAKERDLAIQDALSGLTDHSYLERVKNDPLLNEAQGRALDQVAQADAMAERIIKGYDKSERTTTE